MGPGPCMQLERESFAESAAGSCKLAPLVDFARVTDWLGLAATLQGLRREDLEGYLQGRSQDFVEAASAIARLTQIKLAVATGSDPLEYDLPGQDRNTHILGPDLAGALIDRWCPSARSSFEIMVGYDFELHGGDARNKGKRHHMRLIAEHYGVRFDQMVLFDDSQGCLENEDGWVGIRVRDTTGFRFEDAFEDPSH